MLGGDSVPAPEQKKYAAFISYRHLSPDKEIARELHKLLERNQVRPNRHVPRNIRPVFLDTGELPLLENLDDGILHALENSECLFVICSPNLPLSKYCMREISYFKQLHGGSMRRIYTLLVDGTPAEAFPEILRTETRIVRGEDGKDRAETVEVEPLFADVRADTLRQSLKKLRKTEFLRLAAAYYGCTYDALYKRRRRWLWKVGAMAAACAAAAVIGFTGYAHVRNLQYSMAKAAAYASYARERSEAGDELLALTLCSEAWDDGAARGSSRYMTALRSAAVQYDYKLRASPVAAVMQSSYLVSANTVFYLSEDEASTLTVSDYIAQFNDAKTGEIKLMYPVDMLKVNPRDLSYYITISSVGDEEGVLWDTVSLWSLQDHRLLNSFSFRRTSTRSPSYQLHTIIDAPEIMVLTDGGEPVAWLDRDGNQLSQQEGITLAVSSDSELTAGDGPYYIASSRSILGGASTTVKNQQGETLLQLEGENQLTAFSPDWTTFAYICDGTLRVYDTAAWELLREAEVPDGLLQTLHVLQDSTYVLISYRSDWWYSYLMDWRTGQVFGPFSGHPVVSQTDHSFYCTGEGKLTRYQYTPMDLTQSAEIIAQHDSLCLAWNDTQVLLMDADSQCLLLQMDFGPQRLFATASDEVVQASADLSCILVSQAEGLCCYDSSGTLKWSAPVSAPLFALARDGQTAAWVDAGQVQVVSAADGTPLYAIDLKQLEGAEQVQALAVSSDGVYLSAWNANYDSASWFFPAGTNAPVALADYSSGTLYENGLLFLEQYSYVYDFAVWDVKTGAYLYQPLDNTGLWRFSPQSGYLVRHVETSGNHGTLELEVLRLRKGRFEVVSRIPLPNLNLTSLFLDDSGEVLSYTAGDTTRIYRLKNMSPLLETTTCPLFYNGGRFFSAAVTGSLVYSTPLLEGDALYAFAMEAITSASGQRELSLAERSRYSFEE